MRIISGDAKGRTLYAPKGSETRPTSDKIRGSLFNIIGARVLDARVIDLFGGTGALALEAISRGAERAVIADVSTDAIRTIERNAKAVAGDGFSDRIVILRADYRAAIERACRAGDSEAFDLVFLDPPYRMTDAYGDALERLYASGRLDRDCLIVMERSKSAAFGIPEYFERFDERVYGDTVIEFARLREACARLYENSAGRPANQLRTASVVCGKDGA